MYAGAIVSHPEVAGRTLKDLIGQPRKMDGEGRGEEQEDETRIPVMLLIDTQGCGMLEDSSETEQSSHRNNHEADIVFKHAKALLEAGVEPHQIGVITPYNGQLEALKGLFNPVEDNNAIEISLMNKLRKVELKTIDGFQVSRISL